MYRATFLFLSLWLGNFAPDSNARESIDFETQIRPLLTIHCGKCHGPKVQKSGLRLDARHAAMAGGDSGPVVVAGESGESELLRRITSDDPDEQMPPDGPRLPDEEASLIGRWIDAGAKWPETEYDRQAVRDPRREHWSFQPVRPVTPPDVPENVSTELSDTNEIDRFIIARLADAKLRLSPPADRRTLIRRMSFDLLGLPPGHQQIDAFASDDDPAAYTKLVEEMLQSPRYGERWAQHWLDIIRYADTHGFEVNTPRENAWPYRDYVIRAMNHDKPYDQFICEQLAGDALQVDEATGFLVASAVLLPGQIGKDDESKRLARQDELDEIVVGTGATLLGLTIGCARCHDHKFDPLTSRDYYAMQAFFAGVEYGDRPVRDEKDEQQAAALQQQLNALRQRLVGFEPRALAGRTLIMDEDDPDFIDVLQKKNGHGANPAGGERGYKDDVGSVDRVANLSRGRYTWWNNVPGQDVLTYTPNVVGRFRLWLSWGSHGSGVHTRDARYVLDRDGDLATTEDQREVAQIDQYYQANVHDGTTEKKPLWSGLYHVGVVELTASSKLVLRGGDTGQGITADVIVLQEEVTDHQDRNRPSPEALDFPILPSLRAPVNALDNVERFAPQAARLVRFTTLATNENNRYEPCIDELEIFTSGASSQNVALAKSGAKASSSGDYDGQGIHRLEHINDGRYGNSHSWISNQRGAGWVQIEFPQVEQIDRIVWARDREGKLDDRLPVRYRIEVSMDGELWKLIAGNADRVPVGTPHDSVQTILRGRGEEAVDIAAMAAEFQRLQEEIKQLGMSQMVYGGKFRTPDTTHMLRRGDPEQRLEPLGPAVPAVFGTVDVSENTPEQKRRMALADWIASPANPLTARVMVNRIWQYHFGRGLVDTSSDFGLNGSRPSHPQLLDWLADEFVRSKWSVKHIHRLILMSATYRQSSRIDAAATKIDRDSRWLWRFPSRRLESEAIRDGMLSVSGELNLKMGGPGFNFFKSRGGLNGFPTVDEFGANELRRMIYAHKIRMESVPVFGAFDCPDAGQATPQRSRSTTAIQSLNLFNSRFVFDRAEQFARRVQNDAGHASVSDQVTLAFRMALGRKPTDVELSASTPTADEHGLATVCRVLFNSNEFLFMP